MELKIGSDGKIQIKSNIGNLKQNGFIHTYKVTNSKFGEYVKIHGNRVYLKDLEQIEDYYIGYGKYISQFYFKQ